MSELKHTPGPWRVEEGTTLIWGDCNPDDQSSYGMGYPISECRITPSGSWAKGPRKYEEAEANARLIAAAPDLAVAGKHLAVKLAEVYRAAGQKPSACQAIRDWMAAISKAEGRAESLPLSKVQEEDDG